MVHWEYLIRGTGRQLDAILVGDKLNIRPGALSAVPASVERLLHFVLVRFRELVK